MKNEYKLVIAEKPSVAMALAKVLGADHRNDGYLEGNGYIVSWCVGHLVELAPPEYYNENLAKWRYEDLPILPQHMDQGWSYLVSQATEKQFYVLNSLMKREDVTGITLATDSGREGELLGRLVYHQCHCTKPMDRLWISSMEDNAILEGFQNLKPSSEYDALYEAALCRERADWIVGINATRLFSCLYHQTLQVGRVMTPTLAMVVLRDAEIRAFQSQPFYRIQLELGGFTVSSERIMDKAEAERVFQICSKIGEVKVIHIERNERKEKPPALYDLTSLQREANRVLGYSAKQTLDYAQALYEKKLITYPRTDSSYLPESMASDLISRIEEIASEYGIDLEEFDEIAEHLDDLMDDEGVTDHHAIIPTKSCLAAAFGELPEGERNICMLIIARFLDAIADSRQIAETTVEVTCGDTVFTIKGKEILKEGWKKIERKLIDFRVESDKKKESVIIPSLEEGMVLQVQNATVKEGKTTPPKRYTEDTLLSAMEAAGRVEVPKGSSLGEPERKGLGTPATRAGIIEKLVRIGLIERRGENKTKYLVASDKGNSLITVMPEQIQSASMTADWELKLLRIEHDQYSSESFMNEIEDMVADLVANYEVIEDSDVLMNQKHVIGTCPHCGGDVADSKKGWFCSNKKCGFVLWKDNAFFRSLGKTLTEDMAAKLLREGKIYLSNCKSRKSAHTFNATIHLKTDEEGKASFTPEFSSGNKKKKAKGGSGYE
ncbi:MAG: DNA topoisomerase 3 [Eubacteriales bacterium]|nr:DNA topoisomerase 3 [Eubacteriales bacterium]